MAPSLPLHPTGSPLRRLLYAAVALIALAVAATEATGCSSAGSGDDDSTGADSARFWPDTLRVVTLYSPTSYFIYKEEPMGYDYELLTKLAADKGFSVDLQVAPSLSRAVEMLDSGFVDLIAYEIPVTAEYKEHVVHCGVEMVTSQVLVQPRGDSIITDVTQLVGREVYVENGSKYYHRLLNLNDELGGGIAIHTVDIDTLITEDMIEMVADGRIPLTVVDSDIAALNKTYFSNLDITMPISYPQRSQWGTRPGLEAMADSITAWSNLTEGVETNRSLLKRYFELSKKEGGAEADGFNITADIGSYTFSGGRVSPYDELFKKYAATIGWDWRLLSAQGFAESRFNNSLVSWAGARGLMQIMPSTARAFGLSGDQMTDNEASIATAAKIIAKLDESLKPKVADPEERKKFIVAAYNSGLAHIYDAIALAEKYGLDPCVWDGNVEEAVLMKTKPQYYNDPVCRYGYFRGRQTVEYVKRVYAFYDRSCAAVER